MRLARRFAISAGLAPEAADRLAVVVEEWIANIVEHGAPDRDARIVVRLALADAVVRVTISDPGRPFDPRDAPFAGPNHERGGGAGLALIASHCRIAAYDRRRGRNHVVLELPLA